MNDAKVSRFEVLARDYVLDRCEAQARPMYHGGIYYEWDGRRYREVADLDMSVRTWLRTKGQPQDNRTLANTIPIVKNLGFVPALAETSLPAWQPHDALPDPLPDPKNVVAFHNGLLDIRDPDRGLVPHTPLWLSTSCLPFNYDPTATCPRWLDSLAEVYEVDAGRIGLLQEWAGYLLTTDTSQQKMLLMLGMPRSGKGTIHRVLGDLVGDGATGYRLPLLASSFGLSPLLGKTAAFVPEVEMSGRTDKAEITEVLKSIVGEDAMAVNRKGLPIITAKLGVRFSIACNTIPTLWDASSALGRRMLVIEHRVSFAGRENTNLSEQLRAELPGIATWALAGLRRLRSQGKFSKGADAELERRMALQSAPLQVFVAERCVVSRGADSGLPGLTLTSEAVEVRKDRLFEAYDGWCLEHDVADRTNPVWFARDLRAVLPKIDPNQKSGGHRVFRGIGLRAAE